MDALPSELHDAVLEQCDFASLKTLRLTCRVLSEAASRLVFRDVYMVLCNEHLAKVEAISHSPRLAELVKSFTFHGELLPEFATQAQWELRIDLRPPLVLLQRARMRETAERKRRALKKEEQDSIERTVRDEWDRQPRHDKTPEQLASHYRLYCELRRQQMEWADERQGAAFRAALTRMPALHIVKVEESNATGNVRPGWIGLLPKLLQGPSNWGFARSLTSAVFPMRNRFRSVHQMSSLLEAVVEKNHLWPQAAVNDVELITSGDAFWSQAHRMLPEWVPSDDLNPRVYAMRFAFRPLTRLRIRVSFVETDHTTILTLGLATFLRQATLLEDLTLEFVEENLAGVEENEKLCDILPLIEHIVWPRLRVLALTLTSTEDSFLRMLQRHAATLKVLHLLDSSLRVAAGSWANILRQIPHILKLEKIYLEALIDGTIEIGKECLFELYENGAYEKAFEDYLLRGGEFPILDKAEFYRHHGTQVINPDDDAWEDCHPDQESNPTEDEQEPIHVIATALGQGVSESQATDAPLVIHHEPSGPRDHGA